MRRATSTPREPSASFRTLFGVAVGAIAGIGLALLMLRGVSSEGVSTSRGLIARWQIVIGCALGGMIVGAAGGFLSPRVTSAGRSAILGGTLGAPLMLIGVFWVSSDLLVTLADWVMIGLLGTLTGAGTGALFYVVDERIAYPDNVKSTDRNE